MQIKHKTEFESGVIYLGDSLEILPALSENSAHVAVTSPPYNLVTDKKQYGTKVAKGAERQFKDWYPDDLPELVYQDQQKQIITELMRVCDSSIFYNHKVRYAWHSRCKHRTPSSIYHPLNWVSDFPIWCEIIWDRCGIGRPSSRYHVSDERIYQIGRPIKWSNDRSLTNIWRIPPSKNEGHVCSFPLQLVENCILPTTDEGDTVIDPYLGSGTTAVACIKHNRRFIGIEKSEKYYKLACENIERALEQPRLL
jgi:DNA modification methylase